MQQLHPAPRSPLASDALAGRRAVVTGASRGTGKDAKQLALRKGAPLLVERRLIADQHGSPLELTESRYAGDRYGLDVEFDVELAVDVDEP